MPYLDEAARQLGISEKTLRRWLRMVDPPITPTAHKYDRRYWLITDSDVEVIRRARSELPGVSSTQHINKPYNDALRAKSTAADAAIASPAFPPLSPMPRPRPQQSRAFSDGGLPPGMLSRTDAADLHGIPRSTFRRWCDEGRIETDGATYGGMHGQFETARPVTQRGLAMLYQLASHKPGFTRCAACPHDAGVGATGAAETAAE